MGKEEVLDLSFQVARQAAPKARLVYNDYMSQEVGNEKHRYGVLKLLEGFKKRGTPVDALGIQSHIGAENADTFTGFGKPQEKEWTAFLNDVTGMGYDLLVAEFDVHDKGLPYEFGPRDAAVAAYAKAFLDQVLSYRQTKEVLAWGMIDKYSWLQGQWLREDKKPKRPTLYDDDYKPKPLREAVAAALRALGEPYESQLRVVETLGDSPATGLVRADDIILAVNDEPVRDVTALRAAIADNGTADPASLLVLRGGSERTIEVVPRLSDVEPRVPVIGVLIAGEYVFPFEVDIELENVGGPSAGMMFALGVIDKLTPARSRAVRRSPARARSRPTAPSGRSAASCRRCTVRSGSVPTGSWRLSTTATRLRGASRTVWRCSRWRPSMRPSACCRPSPTTRGSTSSRAASADGER